MKHQPKPLLLIFPFGLLSHYLRCLVLAKHLSPYFKIKVAHHPAYNHFIEQEGFSTFNYSGLNEEKVMQHVKNFDFSWLNERNIEALFKEQVEIINNFKPDAVLGDAMPTLKMAAEYTGVHYISLINGYMSRYYAVTRSLSRTHFAYKYVNQLPDLLKEYAISTGEAIAFRQVHKPFQKLRRKYNLNWQGQYLNETEGDQTLICDLPDLFPQKQLPAGFSVIGPLVYTSSNNSESKALRLDPDKKTIYVSMGSSGNWENLSFLNDIYYQKYNIIAAGDSKGILSATHISHARFINADALFPAVDLVICHGGNGTIYQALAYGIPLLCMTAHFEQEWNVTAIHNAGLALSLDDVSPDDLPVIIEEWTGRKNLPAYEQKRKEIEEATLGLSTKFSIVAQKAGLQAELTTEAIIN
jgi:UDP:flavonoid glycosyltransferase YjiC (YdhE family)